MKNKIMSMLLTLLIFISSALPSYAYDIVTNEPVVAYEQAYAYCKDRGATKVFLDNLEYVYSYSKKIGIDPTIVVVISYLETGGGKSNAFIYKNNPGGIKTTSDTVKRFDSVKQGYKYMIELIGIYGGQLKPSSWLHGTCNTFEDLGGYYWVENGRDSGYYSQVKLVIKTMLKYPKNNNNVDIEENATKETLKETIKETKRTKNKSALDVIKNLLNKNHDRLSGYDYIMQFVK